MIWWRNFGNTSSKPMQFVFNGYHLTIPSSLVAPGFPIAAGRAFVAVKFVNDTPHAHRFLSMSKLNLNLFHLNVLIPTTFVRSNLPTSFRRFWPIVFRANINLFILRNSSPFLFRRGNLPLHTLSRLNPLCVCVAIGSRTVQPFAFVPML